MLIKVNKKISASKAVQYSALSSGLNMATSSGVWHDEETSNLGTAKRQNRIRVTRDLSKALAAEAASRPEA